MERNNDIKLAGVTRESFVDGIGIRYVIYAQGCAHQCKGCHNPDTHDYNNGYACNVDDIVCDIEKQSMIDGITCSGGECFDQAAKFAYIANKAKALGLTVWAYTGYTFEYIMAHLEHKPDWKEFLANIDVLVDGKYEEKIRDLSLSFRASSNQRIIDVQNSIKGREVVIFNLDKRAS